MKIQGNHPSIFLPVSDTQTVMSVDATNKQVGATLGDTIINPDKAVYFQVQVQDADMHFTLDGSDPTGSDYFIAEQGSSVVWSIAALRVSRWTRADATNGKLVMTGVEI